MMDDGCWMMMMMMMMITMMLLQVSMMNMADVWKIYDKEILETPMPGEYQDLCANIQCRDCLKPSLTAFHILGKIQSTSLRSRVVNQLSRNFTVPGEGPYQGLLLVKSAYYSAFIRHYAKLTLKHIKKTCWDACPQRS